MKYLTRFIVLIICNSCHNVDSGAEAGKAYCKCISDKNALENETRNRISVIDTCQKELAKEFPYYNMFIKSMTTVDSVTVRDWDERNKARLFMHDFVGYVRANCPGTI